MRELADLEIDKYISSEQPVIEHEINEKVFLIEGEPLLPRLEKEALTQLKQKVLDVGNDSRL